MYLSAALCDCPKKSCSSYNFPNTPSQFAYQENNKISIMRFLLAGNLCGQIYLKQKPACCAATKQNGGQYLWWKRRRGVFCAIHWQSEQWTGSRVNCSVHQKTCMAAEELSGHCRTVQPPNLTVISATHVYKFVLNFQSIIGL